MSVSLTVPWHKSYRDSATPTRVARLISQSSLNLSFCDVVKSSHLDDNPPSSSPMSLGVKVAQSLEDTGIARSLLQVESAVFTALEFIILTLNVIQCHIGCG
ncbi:MAG: hypothetical protein WBA43_16665 [Elainellaceae cyanobacterium]